MLSIKFMSKEYDKETKISKSFTLIGLGYKLITYARESKIFPE